MSAPFTRSSRFHDESAVFYGFPFYALFNRRAERRLYGRHDFIANAIKLKYKRLLRGGGKAFKLPRTSAIVFALGTSIGSHLGIALGLL